LAAVWIQQRFGNNALLLALPADHLVKNTIAFWRAADSALQAAKQGHLALLGVTPTYPATGYGYIECAPQISIANTEDCFPVRRFVEKPPLEDATTFVQDGNFYWNTGIFCFTPRTLMEEMPQTAVDIMPPLQALAKTAPTDNNRWLPDTPLHAQFPNISFDYAVMEKTKKAAMAVVAGAEWNDVGSWHSLGETLPADTRGNRTDGDTLLIDCDNCLVAGGGRLIAGIALKNLHIIDSPDALLVANADSAERTREVFDQLRATNRDEATTPATVHRPWGTYTVLEESHSHKVKRIEVLPGAQLSLQSHQHRSEHWTTVTGTMTIVIGERTFDMETNQSCYISQGEKHRMANRTDQPASIIEVQVGDYFGEDDIIRYEDLYGRI
jgi:mannose-1-phosphate guanylyltransferase